MRIFNCLVSFIFIALSCFAQGAESVKLGDVIINTKNKSVYFKKLRVSSFTIQPGGRMLPTLYIYENGDAAIGGQFLKDGIVGKYRTNNKSEFLLRHDIKIKDANHQDKVKFIFSSKNKVKCEFIDNSGSNQTTSIFEKIRSGGALIAAASDSVGVLTQNYSDSVVDGYSFRLVNLNTCKVDSIHLEDLDSFSEIGWTNSGKWWLVGSTEQTLLVSDDGLEWRNIPLPTSIFSLVSAYIVSANDIWLAAGFGLSDDNSDPFLVRSTDGGISWKKVTRDSSDFEVVPLHWLEGQARFQNVLLN